MVKDEIVVGRCFGIWSATGRSAAVGVFTRVEHDHGLLDVTVYGFCVGAPRVRWPALPHATAAEASFAAVLWSSGASFGDYAPLEVIETEPGDWPEPYFDSPGFGTKHYPGPASDGPRLVDPPAGVPIFSEITTRAWDLKDALDGLCEVPVATDGQLGLDI